LDWRKLTGGVIKSSLFSNKRGGKKRIFIFAKCKKNIRQKNMLCKLLLSVFLSFERYSAVGVCWQTVLSSPCCTLLALACLVLLLKVKLLYVSAARRRRGAFFLLPSSRRLCCALTDERTATAVQTRRTSEGTLVLAHKHSKAMPKSTLPLVRPSAPSACAEQARDRPPDRHDGSDGSQTLD